MTDLPDPAASDAAATTPEEGAPQPADAVAVPTPTAAGPVTQTQALDLPAVLPAVAASQALAAAGDGGTRDRAMSGQTNEGAAGGTPADGPAAEAVPGLAMAGDDAPTAIVEPLALAQAPGAAVEGFEPPPPPDAGLPASPPATVGSDAAVAAKPPRRRRSLALRFALSFVVGVALVLGIGAGALYAWGQQYEGRILPGVRVGSADLSGLTRDQADGAIAQAYASLGDGQIVLNGPDGKTTISYADVGRGPDTQAILAAAIAAGRQGEPLADLIGAPQAAIHGVTLGSAVVYDTTKLAAAVDALAASVDQPATNASVIAASGGGFAVVPAADGRAVDTQALLAALDAKLTSLDTPAEIDLDVPMTRVAPAITTAAAAQAKSAADRMAADLVLARGSDSWTIKSADLQPLISFAVAGTTINPVVDESGLDPVLKVLASQVNQSAKDAGLKLVGSHVVATGSSQEGRSLNVAATKTAIVNQLAAREAGTAIGPIAPVVKAVAPKLSLATAQQYASKMKAISSYSVYYWVLINNHWGGNIEGPARVINGTVIPAGGTFDFWKVVGDLHNVPGVGPGNAIEGGKITVTGAFGGGICTTSTTLFNAAIHAGMVPLARQNHNEFISRYPPRLDATVWIVGNTKQTMSFKNDTQYPILIQSVVQTTGSLRWLTFKIWSVPNGRTVSISKAIIQPGPTAVDTVEKVPSKPVGWSYRVNTPVNGAKVWVTVTIKDHGQLHWSKTFFSNYPAVNGVLQVGTKGA